MDRQLAIALLLVACQDGSGLGVSATSERGPLHEGNVEERRACLFGEGARPGETLALTQEQVAQIPITHVVVRMQENRSFDHYLGMLPQRGKPEVDGIPEGFTNPDATGLPVPAHHLESTCLEADPPHQWEAMNAQWNGGAMDGFVTTAAVDGSDGHFAMGYYDEPDLPFYYWLARTFAISDRYFASSLGGTWSNRNFLYTGRAHGVKDTFDDVIRHARTVFDQLDDAGVAWAVYNDGHLRQDSLGWEEGHRGVRPLGQLFADLRTGRLPPVVFVETSPWSPEDEHPANDVQPGEAWSRALVVAAMESPLWPQLALFFDYDTAGGLLDHVPPPEACVPSPEEADFDRLGMRVPFFLISPWARPGHVSHQVADHTSVLRFIQLLHDLPALGARDANASAMLDLFDFEGPMPLERPPAPPLAGTGGCASESGPTR